MTQQDFNQLPLLVQRKIFKAWTGLNDEDLDAAVAQGMIKTWTRPRRTYSNNYRPKRSYRLYYKTEIMKFRTVISQGDAVQNRTT